MPFRSLEDTDHNRQLVRLRWTAISGVAAAVLASSWLDVVGEATALWLVVAAMASVNTGLALAVRRPGVARLGQRLLVAQLAFDIVALNVLVHCAGGIENPFAFFYVFLALIAGVACPRPVAWALVAGAFAVFAGTAGLVQAGWIPAHPLNLPGGAPPPGARHGGAYLLGFLAVLGAVLFGVVAYATSAMERLREAGRAERAMRDRLDQRERLALVGEVVAGVVHELSTPLNGVRNSFRALRRDPAGFLARADVLDLMEEALDRMVAMSRRLLLLSREPALDRRPVEAHEVVARMLDHLRDRIQASGAAIERRLQPVPAVLADEVALGEILTNLLSNALDAVEGGGRVTVETGNGGGAVEIRVADTGPGIAPAIQARLFQPFQSTKPLGRGTGLGLAISKRLVDAHAGTIAIDSREGAGTTVTVRLPLAGRDGP